MPTMTSLTSPHGFESTTAGDDVPPPPMNIVILYDDQTAYRRAMHLLADMLAGRANESAVRPLPRRFEELRFHPWRERAQNAAAEAEIFIIATSAKAPLPTHVTEWLSEAFAGRSVATAGVSVVYDADEDVHYFGALCETLVRHEADVAGLPFLEPGQLAIACFR
ncbi:MAG TPA: hypothetical protein VHD62_07235 [Opitutaceae bacterium]|nr:hypothetical protein [Opitutaceae bacterium]